MVGDFLAWAPTIFQNDVMIGVMLFASTAIVISLWVPGVLLPIAVSSGALLNTWWGSAVVAGGALIGSIAIFVTARHYGHDKLPVRIADFIAKFEHRFKTHGAWWVLLLRLLGAPHFLVSAGSAMMPIQARSFALATLAGMTPSILLAAAAGSSLAP